MYQTCLTMLAIDVSTGFDVLYAFLSVAPSVYAGYLGQLGLGGQ